MSNKKGKTTQYDAPTPEKSGADPAPANLIDVSKPNFLLVNVCKGVTKEGLLKAIDEALKTSDMPFFKERKATGAADAEGAAEYPPASGDGVEALLMLVRQEGW